MTLERFEALLLGDEPTKEDYFLFLALVEHCGIDVIWTILHRYPNLNWMLRSAANKCLQEKAKSEITDDMLHGILERLKSRDFPFSEPNVEQA